MLNQEKYLTMSHNYKIKYELPLYMGSLIASVCVNHTSRIPKYICVHA